MEQSRPLYCNVGAHCCSIIIKLAAKAGRNSNKRILRSYLLSTNSAAHFDFKALLMYLSMIIIMTIMATPNKCANTCRKKEGKRKRNLFSLEVYLLLGLFVGQLIQQRFNGRCNETDRVLICSLSLSFSSPLESASLRRLQVQ